MGIEMSAEARKEFPEHWGPPPRIQTKDLRPLPGGYGRGSSTLAGWIKNNMDADARGRPSSRVSRINAVEQRVAEEAAAQAEAERRIRVAAANAAEKEAAESKLMSGGKGDYMDFNA